MLPNYQAFALYRSVFWICKNSAHVIYFISISDQKSLVTLFTSVWMPCSKTLKIKKGSSWKP